MRSVSELEADHREPTVRFGISANITSDLCGVYLRRHFLLVGGRAMVAQGVFDSHLDNVRRFVREGVDHLLLINFFDQLMPSLELRLSGLDVDTVAGQCQRMCDELQLVLTEARDMRAVIVPTFHRFTPSHPNEQSAVVDRVIAEFNAAAESVVGQFPNAITLVTAGVVSSLGRLRAFSDRFYLRATAPYLPAFWDDFAARIMRVLRGGETYLYKALIVDCDNTLWGGVVGEDLLDGIELDPDSYPGNVFWRVQHELVGLQRRGVLLCLCSKNNEADVNEVLSRHPHQVLKDEHLILKKLGWGDKVDSIEEIATELNIGLDSIAFLDDSSFEIESVRGRLPAVRCFQVPTNPFEYPNLVGDIANMFLAGRPDDGGVDKTAQYRMRAAEQDAALRASSREDYLASLGLTVELRRDPEDLVARIAGLSQKSNQFNLTTCRYTEADVIERISSPDATVYTLGVSDRFGDSGVTGIAVVLYETAVARVEAFFMSCRVLGRGVEEAPWPTIAADASAHGCIRFEADWLRSQRNEQVEGFYDRLGLTLVHEGPDRRSYSVKLNEFLFRSQPHITLKHG
jgi:FkbH-like protein